uniref:Putative host-nuclease inhibitor protein n=1 Tax=viral metagenome TaxID=1070528 RepID=A0A6M3LLT9_9ZZZZ
MSAVLKVESPIVEPEELVDIEAISASEADLWASEAEDEATIERYLRAYRYYQAEASRIQAAAQAERNRIDAWELKKLAHPTRASEFLTFRLRQFSEAIGKSTRISPNGSLSWRRQPEHVEIADTDAFIAAHRGTGFVRVKEEVDKSAIKAAVKATGELPEGAELVRGEDKFVIEVE